MSSSFSFGEVRLDVNPASPSSPARPDPETPFRIAVLGDFSGRGSRGIVESGQAMARRRRWLIDRDNLDEVMERLEVELDLPVAGKVRFRELEDFHPDRLYTELEMFQKLREAEQEAARAPVPPPAPRRPPSPPPPDLSLDGLLEAAVEATESAASEPRPAPKDKLHAWVEETVAPHLEPKADPRREQIRALIDKTATAQMRALMHYPTFQALEAAWRAMFFLVRRVETGPKLKLYLMDVSKQELAADLGAADEARETGVYQLLAGDLEEAPWAVIAGLYTFGAAGADMPLLARLAVVAKALGAPLLAGAGPRLAGCKSLAASPDPAEWREPADAGWEAFRATPAAASVGLALPRFLLRLPYGRETDPCEAFAFEEMGEQPEHERYLWGNPAIACASLLAESFAASEWDFRPGQHLRIDGLPLHVYRRDGESVAQPCAETLLGERAAERILENGLMALASYRDRDSIRLVRFQSAARPAAPLAAWWAR